MRTKHDNRTDSLGELQVRHWRLITTLTGLCADIERAGADERKVLDSALQTVCGLLPRATFAAFLRKKDAFVSVGVPGRENGTRITAGEWRSFRARSVPAMDTASDRVLPVSADDFACFGARKRSSRHGLVALLGATDDPGGVLFLWPKGILLQEDEDVFSVVASCLGSAFAMAAAAEAKAATAEKKVTAWRDMATKIAHLTTTPLVLAECEMRDLDANASKRLAKPLASVRCHIEEARRALDRAFLFEHAGETVVRDWYDLSRVVREAFAALGVECPNIAAEKAQVYGNYFRMWFAVRDLLASARAICRRGCGIRYHARIVRGRWILRVAIPVVVSEDFDKDCLFSPQCYVAGREDHNRNWPLSMSLFLARQLVSELRSGNIDSELSDDRSTLTMCLECAVRVEA